MKRKAFFLSICMIFSCFLSGCMLAPGRSKPVISDDTVTVRLHAQDYIGREKAEVESLLGGFVQEEYYNGGLIYRFARSNMWFWFGTDAETFDQIPNNAKCCFVLAPLAEAASFNAETVSAATLSEKLDMAFFGPAYNELDCVYNFSAEKNGIACTVSCNENGIASVKDDFVTYSLIS